MSTDSGSGTARNDPGYQPSSSGIGYQDTSCELASSRSWELVEQQSLDCR